MMDSTQILKEAFEKQDGASGNLAEFQQENWKTFSGLGLPAIKHEEWKYTRIRNVFFKQTCRQRRNEHWS